MPVHASTRGSSDDGQCRRLVHRHRPGQSRRPGRRSRRRTRLRQRPAPAHRALAARPAPPRLVVDLAGVTFCDSTGLSTLLQSRIYAERQRTAVHLARPTHIVARVLEITGADQVFPIDSEVPAPAPRTGAG
ncbi:STAS domain-containing protein [Kitasatospora sp. NPDC057015]|uniref:STAS domain-containing protein n=1 Tax=Kitasatospora sp. NPDC057015 TaxID=3346001 RepID=UPI00363127F4